MAADWTHANAYARVGESETVEVPRDHRDVPHGVWITFFDEDKKMPSEIVHYWWGKPVGVRVRFHRTETRVAVKTITVEHGDGRANGYEFFMHCPEVSYSFRDCKIATTMEAAVAGTALLPEPAIVGAPVDMHEAVARHAEEESQRRPYVDIPDMLASMASAPPHSVTHRFPGIGTWTTYG